MLNQSSKTRSAGFSLLELLLVVAVGAVLILAGLGAYRLVSEGSNANRATQQISTLKQAVQQAFAGQGVYTAGSLVATLNTMRALPSDMSIVGTGVRDAFGGTTFITGSGGATFTVAMQSVPTSACIKLAQTYTTANSSDVVSVAVGAPAAGAAVPAGGTAITVFTLANLTAVCGGTATHSMVWTFR